nr:NB-ARC domain-containing protein [[Phormidium] sp. ETS-05]
MDIDEVLQLADDLVFAKTGSHLDYLQQAILKGSLQDKTYSKIAEELHLSQSHVRNVGSNLWQLLSDQLGESLTKSNFLPILKSASFSNNKNNISFLGETVTVNESLTVNNLNICPAIASSPAASQNAQPTPQHPRIDLGDAPELTNLCNRTDELTTLKQWILEKNTSLITLLGLTGTGKTVLAVQLVQQIQAEFDFIIWRSLATAPSLPTLQTNLIEFLSGEQQPKFPDLIHYLRSDRCLLIFDDMQTIFSTGTLAGEYQPGYENYGLLFKKIAETSHNSCLLLLSWEKPREIAILEGSNRPARTLQLKGLGEQARQLLREKQLAPEEKWSELIQLYQGNPLWLNIVAATIQELCSGSVDDFLSYQTLFLGDLEAILHHHFLRLSELEKKALSWLANQPNAIEILKITADLPMTLPDFLKVMQSLSRRCLLETVKDGNRQLFTLQPVIREFVKNHLPN